MRFPTEYYEENPIGFDGSKVVHTFSASSNSWTATEDCYICGFLYYTASMGADNAYVVIAKAPVASAGGVKIGATFYDGIGAVCAPVRKGQKVVVHSSDYSQIKCYGK